jgi:hypothetical protein
MNLVKVISTRIEEGMRLIKFLRYGLSDVQECNNASSFGDDSNAPKDWVAVYSSTGEMGSPVIVGYLNKDQISGVGEKRIFSVKSNGSQSQYIWLKNDETIEIGGDEDNLVRYSKLETAFNELKSDHNDLALKWSTFASTYVPGSPSTVGLPPTLAGQNVNPSTADISPAKIDEIFTS